MEAGDIPTDVVHPEVRAHINSLVSALGGCSADDDGRYKLGDDALECLRDMKRWIRFYDEKTNRMDVARCLAEANLVAADLLPILAMWPENATEDRFKARIALACFEVMVPLTWPVERDLEKMTVNHHRHLPVLELAQLAYKRAIINFDGAQILHTAVRIALPSMAMSMGDRTPRDQGIIKLALFFLRNMAMIAPPPGVKYDGDESQISRSATIDAFSYQDIFLTLLTIASNMGDEFRTEDVIIMEILFHLLKRVDLEKLFLNEQQLNKAKAGELTAMMNKEAAMLRSYNRKAPTRHNRFGTMVWVKRDDGKMSSLSGQDALLDAASRERKLDNTKVFKPPRRARKDEMEPKDLGTPVSLNARANDQLRGFVDDFLDSGFNPLFLHVRKSIDREAPYVLHYHRRQFFYLVAWFLEAERTRQKAKKSKGSQPSSGDDISGFNLVASVLNQEMFISLNRAMSRSYDDKDWVELTFVMRCFTQILLTVQEMSDSGNEEDEEIAENTLNRIFYEEATHDAIANIARTYKDQGFEYLDACTELTHTYLRILEAYSKQNVDLQVRSRRRVRKKKKAAKTAGDGDEENREENDDSENDQANAERTTKERKFDFKRFAHRFSTQGVVDTFAKYLKFYRDLNDSQLKRAHRFFYRVAFKQDMSVMLFRVDIVHLLYNMIKGPEALDKSSGMFKEWEELVKQILKRCIRKIEERPALIIEMLFSKINSTAHYLEYGYEKQTISSNPRAGAELEFRHAVERDQQIAIVVGALLDKGQEEHIAWVKKQLSAAESERRSWEAAEKAFPSVEGSAAEGSDAPAAELPAKDAPSISVRPDNEPRRMAMFKNSHLRLLMKLVGFQNIAPALDETPESAWTVAADVSADQMKESLGLISKAEFSPPTFNEGQLAEDQLRRKTAPRKRAAFDDGEEGGGDDEDDEMLFEAGPRLTSKAADGAAAARPKKRKRLRRKDGDGDGEGEGQGEEAAAAADEAELEERARSRREREREKMRKIKSEAYVHASDDESDDEYDRGFFAREEAIRQRVKRAIAHELDKPEVAAVARTTTAAPEDGAVALLVSEDEDEDEEMGDDDDEDGDGGTTARSSSAPRSAGGKGTALGDEDRSAPLAKLSKRRKVLAFVDSSDDESDVSPDSLPSAPKDVDGDGDVDMQPVDTPATSSPRVPAEVVNNRAPGRGPLSAASGNLGAPAQSESEDEDAPVAGPARKRGRVKSGFVVDSSDEE